MIIDTIENLAKYETVNPLFRQVVEFIATHKLEELPEGKHPIQGADLFVNITTAKGRTPDEAFIETHRRMIDIQIPLDDEKDITKYPNLLAESFIDCMPGMFAIFFPQDGHAPCISVMPEIKKAIFKVKNYE